MSFEELGLDERILKAIKESGYSDATPIQLKAIPKILDGFDIKGCAQTGTGKTAAFLLPALQKIVQAPKGASKGPKVLILAPTRELAIQISTQAEKYSKYVKFIKTTCVYGGAPLGIHIRKLKSPVSLLIATPGRLIDLLERRKVDLSSVEMVILDEADRMLDMGFIGPVEQIVGMTPSERQTLLFSATLKGSVMKLAEKLLSNPLDIVVHAPKEENKNIKQRLVYTDNLRHKNELLEQLLNDEEINRAIIFTSTKKHTELLVEELHRRGHHAAPLNGDMKQRQRIRTITKLRDGEIKILVATDVAARGIDVSTITHVINFDLPQSAEDYVHRIGRTGRAGATGSAISFVAKKDLKMVKEIERYTGQPLEGLNIPKGEPDSKPKKRAPFKRKKPGPFFKDRKKTRK